MWFKETIRQYYSLIVKHHKRHKLAYAILYAIFAYILSNIVGYLWLKYTIYVWIGIGIIVVIGYAFIIATIKYYRKIAVIVSVWLFLFGIFIYFYNPNPEIYKLIQWYSLLFEDSFIDGNIKLNWDYNWIRKKDWFENWKGGWEFQNSITIKFWVDPESKNAIYQDISKFKWEVIMIGKFYIKRNNSIWFDFINHTEPWTRGSTYQSCGMTTYNWINWAGYNISNSLNYIDFYNGKKRDYSESYKWEISEWVYIILVKISNWKISCFSQKEWDKSYKNIVSDVGFKWYELWWPKLIKYNNTDEPKPYLLDFKLYSKK